jgi:RND superfamily putative drug exporter
MINLITKIGRLAASPKGAKIVFASWVLLVVVLSTLAPSAKNFAVSSGDGSVLDNNRAAIAQAVLEEHFPTEDGLIALLVFHSSRALTVDETEKIKQVSSWLASADRPEQIASALPFHQLSSAMQEKLFSEDKTTLILNIALTQPLDSDKIHAALKQIRTYIEQLGMGNIAFEITGPAGIASDTISLFKNADFVLMFATIGLILLLLFIIYRSPLLAIIPLVIAGIVYMVVDRVLGLGAKLGWFLVDKQGLSIMMILLFAVLTDYCLFIFSRYREELKRAGSKYDAMRVVMTHIAEPIMFSGGTVLIAMLALLAAIYEPYHYFAPVFAVAMVIIVLGGLTLIPATFALVGRKAFWPFAAKLDRTDSQPSRIWLKMAGLVTRRPAVTVIMLLTLLVAASVNILGINYSFNLMKSFPDDSSSRKGFEILESRFPQGQLAPVTIILESEQELVLNSINVDKIARLEQAISAYAGISSITPEVTRIDSNSGASLPMSAISGSKHAIKLQAVLEYNPYEPAALDLVGKLRDNSSEMLQNSGFDQTQYELHYAGQTAQQLDVRSMNTRDTLIVFPLITLLITIMLLLQTRSIKLAFVMISTILLSYAATLGLGWSIFHYGLGYEAISYRLPLYTFVFLVALGVDYNIILVSRVKEESQKHEWKEAIRRGVALTGGVISSAGIILAATFSVLITQPLQELFLFGLTMAMGVLIDTFLVRGMLLPAILILTNSSKERNINKAGEGGRFDV